MRRSFCYQIAPFTGDGEIAKNGWGNDLGADLGKLGGSSVIFYGGDSRIPLPSGTGQEGLRLTAQPRAR
jgi:hypothetical protein